VTSALRFRAGLLALAVTVALALTAVLAGGAGAATTAPWWHVEATAAPTVLPAGAKEAQLYLAATNIGDADAEGEAHPITVSDRVPAGLKVTSSLLRIAFRTEQKTFPCTETPEGGATKVSCTYSGKVPAYETLEVRMTLEVTGSPGALENTAHVEGGGAAEGASDTHPLQIGTGGTPFGIERYSFAAQAAGGGPETQAGSHPFQILTDLGLNETLEQNPREIGGAGVPAAPELVRDVQTTLPAGFVGDANPAAIPQCSGLQFATIVQPNGQINECPQNTVVGVAIVTFNEPHTFRYVHRAVPVFSLVPAPGEPARFGFEALKVLVVIDTSVLTGGGYNVVASVRNASEGAQVLGSQIYVWGEPGNEVHDAARGWRCLLNGKTVNGGTEGNPNHEHCAPAYEGSTPVRPVNSFLQMPTDCTKAFESSALIDSWSAPGPRAADGTPITPDARWKEATSSSPHLEGCEKLPFAPSIEVNPDVLAGNTPSGYTVTVRMPQEGTVGLEHEGVPALSTAAVRESTVTLPAGVLLSPSAANGLEACDEGLVGFLGPDPQHFTPHIPEPDELQPGVNFCPNGAKVGTVTIKSPDLANAFEGGVYLAKQEANPFGSLYAMYLIAQDPVSKVTVKLSGRIDVNPTNGQISTTFVDTPEVPFEELTIHLFGGPRASLSTPALCGTYATGSTFGAWSGASAAAQIVKTVENPETHAHEIVPSSGFAITSGAEGSGCANPLPLAPGFSAGSTNTQAGGFTGFETTISHRDSDAAPTSLTMKLPPGLAAMISSVEQCGEAQANAGTCGPGSLIGEATAVAGLGGDPFTETGGRVYITGPYHGAPFGLSIVIPANAGPFEFGYVVTRAALNVDPSTAAVTITSELPTFVNTNRYQTGAPVQLKSVHVVVTRPNFQFNPTHCTEEHITGTLTGVGGASAPLDQRFQASNCGVLPFNPGLTTSTTGTYSRVNGTEFRVTVTSKAGEANIAKTRLVIPEQLPSRLTTIQQACLEKIFNVNPAACNEGSNIGMAIVHTPVLKNPLTGPVYLVAHGGAEFPDVEFVLNGENGLRLILDGKTKIRHGITTSTFETVPDAPVERFEAIFPPGPHSALTGFSTNGSSICGESISIPTWIIGQNGKTVERRTPVAFTGCPKGGVKPFKETRLQKALKSCRKKYAHNHKKRAKCERAARKKYGKKTKHKKKK
jgi:hypothetical protein